MAKLCYNRAMKINVGAVQMDCVLGDVEANLKKAQGFVDEAAQKEVKLLVLPELFSTGYDLKERTGDFAEDDEGPTMTFFKENAAKHGMVLTGTYIEKNPDGKPFNTAPLVGPNGLIGKHRKVYLWEEEKTLFAPGDRFDVWDTEIGKLGIMICYDADFPESSRALATQGAEILLFSTAGTPAFDKFYSTFIASRAFENSCFLIQSNRVGQENDLTYAGYSKVVNPRGEILSDSKQEETLVVAEIDLEDIKKTRENVPYLKDFNPDIYKQYS